MKNVSKKLKKAGFRQFVLIFCEEILTVRQARVLRTTTFEILCSFTSQQPIFIFVRGFLVGLQGCKFLQFEERFRKASFSWRNSVNGKTNFDLTVEKSSVFKFLSLRSSLFRFLWLCSFFLMHESIHEKTGKILFHVLSKQNLDSRNLANLIYFHIGDFCPWREKNSRDCKSLKLPSRGKHKKELDLILKSNTKLESLQRNLQQKVAEVFIPSWLDGIF